MSWRRGVPPFVSPVLVTNRATLLGREAAVKKTGIGTAPALRRRARPLIGPQLWMGVRIIRPYVLRSDDPKLAKAGAEGFDAILTDTYSEGLHGGSGVVSDWGVCRQIRDEVLPLPMVLSGGLNPENVAGRDQDRLGRSQWTSPPGWRAPRASRTLTRSPGSSAAQGRQTCPEQGLPKRGRFGRYGGQFIPETLVPAVQELEQRVPLACETDRSFKDELAAPPRGLRGQADPPLPGEEPHQARGRGEDLPQAGGPAPQRGPQDQQHPRARRCSPRGWASRG